MDTDKVMLNGVERYDLHSAVASFTRQSDGLEITVQVHTPRDDETLSYERARELAWEKLNKWLEDQDDA